MQKYKFQRQIILKNIIIIVAVIIILTVIAIGYILSYAKKSYEEQMDVQLKGITSQIDTALHLADEVALQLAANRRIIDTFEDVQNYNGTNNYFIDNTEQDTELKQYMMSYMLTQNSIARICLLDDKKNFTFSGRAVDYGYLKKDFPNQEFYDDLELFAEGKEAKMFRVDEQDPYVNDSVATISAIRQIKDYQVIPSNRLGYVQVAVPLEKFRYIYSSVLGKETQCYICKLDTGEPIFWCEEREQYNAPNLLTTGYLSDGAYCARKEYREYGISVILISKGMSLISGVLPTFAWMFLLILCIILVIWMGQMQVIKQTTEPIARLCDMVGSFRTDKNLKEIPLIISENDDELMKLNLAFDGLVKNLQDSMEKAMTSRVNEIQSQVFALRAQMNPHFIHNILAVISAMSTDGESGKIPEICEKLSDMIHYNTKFNANYTELKDEVKYAENYLELMKIRYEDKFRYTMVYVGETRPLKVPRFIVQPLLENCFTHGFKKKAFPWVIDIQIFFLHNSWEIRIHDNGSGISAETLETVNKQIEEIRHKELSELITELQIGGLSVKNVFARLYIAYGKNLLFEINHCKNGTEIVIGGSYDDTGTDC